MEKLRRTKKIGGGQKDSSRTAHGIHMPASAASLSQSRHTQNQQQKDFPGGGEYEDAEDEKHKEEGKMDQRKEQSGKSITKRRGDGTKKRQYHGYCKSIRQEIYLQSDGKRREAEYIPSVA